MDARRRDGLAAAGAAAARGHRRAHGQLASHGWAAVLRDLGKCREWAGDGQLYWRSALGEALIAADGA